MLQVPPMYHCIGVSMSCKSILFVSLKGFLFVKQSPQLPEHREGLLLWNLKTSPVPFLYLLTLLKLFLHNILKVDGSLMQTGKTLCMIYLRNRTTKSIQYFHNLYLLIQSMPFCDWFLIIQTVLQIPFNYFLSARSSSRNDSVTNSVWVLSCKATLDNTQNVRPSVLWWWFEFSDF